MIDNICAAVCRLIMASKNAVPIEVVNYIKEKNGRVIDNICAAVCRLIMASKNAVPIEVVSYTRRRMVV